MFSSKFFEALNGTFFVAFCCLLVIFGRFIYELWSDHHGHPHRFRSEAAPAIAIVVVILGDAIIRGSVWVPRWIMNHRVGDVAPYENQFVTAITVGAFIGLWGAWCCARVYGSKSDATVTVVLSLAVGLGMAWPWW